MMARFVYTKTVAETAQYIEVKEVTQNDLTRTSTTSAILAHKKSTKPQPHHAVILIGGIHAKTFPPKPVRQLLFHNDKGWEEVKSLSHPTLILNFSIDENNYIGHNALIISREDPEILKRGGGGRSMSATMVGQHRKF